MTVIRPNSVAGINSITVQSGNSLAVHKANGELIRTITSSSGISTFSTISVGTATTDNSAGKSINIGLGASISQHTNNTLSLGTGGDERLRIDSSGRVLIGHNSSLAIGGGDNSPLQATATSSVVFGGARYVNSSSGPFISLAKSRAASAGSNTIVQDGDELGTILFAGDDGTDLISKGAQIQGQVDGTPGSNDMPGRLIFSTTADGSASPSERARIDSSGHLKIGATANRDLGGLSVQRLHIEGTDGGGSGLGLVNNQNSTGYASIRFGKSRGTSVGSNTVVQSGDPLGGIIFCGSDGTDMVSVGAQILAEVDGTPGSNDMPGRLEFHTTADGSATSTERVRIASNGNVRFAKTDMQIELQTSDGSDNGFLNLSGGGACSQGRGAQVVCFGNEYSNYEGTLQLLAGQSGNANGVIQFYASGSEKVRINADGDVIVHGTSLNNSAVAGQALQINGTTRPTLILRGNASGSNSGEIQFADNSGSDDDNTGIRAGLIKYDHPTNAMTFRVAGTYTGLKISGTNGRLERNFTGGGNTDDDGMWFNNSGSTSGTYIRFWQTTAGANQIGSISHSTSATSFNTSSDYRLKENINAITDAITRLKTLKPSRFNFKTEPSVTVDGFIAHEVTAVPEAITGTKDEVDSNGDPLYQGIDQSKLVPLLTAALQEAVTKIETLETKVAALEGG